MPEREAVLAPNERLMSAENVAPGDLEDCPEIANGSPELKAEFPKIGHGSPELSDGHWKTENGSCELSGGAKKIENALLKLWAADQKIGKGLCKPIEIARKSNLCRTCANQALLAPSPLRRPRPRSATAWLGPPPGA